MSSIRAETKIKKTDPICNRHQDSRHTIYFHTELFIGDTKISDSGIWANAEEKSIRYALENIKVNERVRVNYEPYDIDPRGPDGWGQQKEATPEDRERRKAMCELFDRQEQDAREAAS